MRVCKKCNKKKDLDEFHIRNGFKSHRCKSCDREKWRQNRKNDPERFRAYDRKKLYGLNRNVYQYMLEEQENKCYICGDPPGQKSLNVDHNHKTGKVRKLLCSLCNTGLGGFKDDSDLLLKAIIYLKEHE